MIQSFLFTTADGIRIRFALEKLKMGIKHFNMCKF